MRNMYYVDMHCHSAPKPYSWSLKKDKRGWDCRNVRKSIWYNDPPRVFDKFLNRQTGLTRFTQSDLRTQSRGGVRIFSASLSPIERSFVIPKFWPQNIRFDILVFIDCILCRIIRGLSLKVFACIIIKAVAGFSMIYICRIRRKKRDYFTELCEEYRFYICEAKKQSDGSYATEFVLTKNVGEIKLDSKEPEKDFIYIFFSIEGCHVFNNGGLKRSLKDKKGGGVSEESRKRVEERIEVVKNWAHPPLFASIAHHMNNDLCGHAKSLSPPLERMVDQGKGMNKGFTNIGRVVLGELLSKENGNRIHIDVKHMSVKSRYEYYHKLATDENYNGGGIPIFASHGAVSGNESLKKKVEKESGKWHKEFISDWVREIIIGSENMDYEDGIRKNFNEWLEKNFGDVFKEEYSYWTKSRFMNQFEKNFKAWVEENFREWIKKDFRDQFNEDIMTWVTDNIGPSVRAKFIDWVNENYGEVGSKTSYHEGESGSNNGASRKSITGYKSSSSHSSKYYSNSLYRDVYHSESDLQFNSADVNFYDDEILLIQQTKGFLGIQVDERILCSPEQKQLNKKIKKRGEQLHHQAGLVWKQIRYIAELLDRNERPGWNTAAIGSDFDGLVDPPNGYWSSEDFGILEENLVHHAYHYFRYHAEERLKLEENKHPKSNEPNSSESPTEINESHTEDFNNSDQGDTPNGGDETEDREGNSNGDNGDDEESKSRGEILKKILAKVLAPIMCVVRFLGLTFVPALLIASFKALIIDLCPPPDEDPLPPTQDDDIALQYAMVVIDNFMRLNAHNFLKEFYNEGSANDDYKWKEIKCP
jgi:microsomal dipeptidase-like Zn-dependent dipeptidase